ncbi:two-component sensor histidine kinase [Chitinophaga caeni]|uniref:histidine kinase n=1 Tax=Chitinophaga caeni TaxID=2029983 RepID=A0A291QPT5_9BACT|nr:HAMP domain-containing sensor histidine kinase [Chitinophaga caeni]ATL45935.1 two-component sensor histidine kinase [Chitinophaga caeni]
MWPLKKIFPVIVVLITLSLLGSIAIQVNWIMNAVQLKHDSYNERMQTATRQVLDSIIEKMKPSDMPIYGGRTLRITGSTFDPSGNRFNIEGYTSEYRLNTTINKVSAQEIHHYVDEAFKKQKLKSDYEFGIITKGVFGSTVRMTTPDFIRQFELADSTRFITYYGPIINDLSDLAVTTDEFWLIVPEPSLWKSLGLMIVGNVLFTTIIILAFALTIRTVFSQKKLSEIKSDFINNMTHELKTPLATISLAIDAIGNEKVMENKDKIRYFSGIIKEENKRMNKQVETILQSSLLEKDELVMKLTAIDVHQVISSTVDNLQLQLESKNGKVELQLNAHQPIIQADEVHFSNLVFNLLDNAIKYSKDDLLIKIQTSNTKKSLVLSIADNGIGMSKDTVSRIFEKFYRAHTGNVHNVKGFGLGLAYVKAIVDAHKGKIKVESAIGKGSKFIIEFPQEN